MHSKKKWNKSKGINKISIQLLVPGETLCANMCEYVARGSSSLQFNDLMMDGGGTGAEWGLNGEDGCCVHPLQCRRMAMESSCDCATLRVVELALQKGENSLASFYIITMSIMGTDKGFSVTSKILPAGAFAGIFAQSIFRKRFTKTKKKINKYHVFCKSSGLQFFLRLQEQSAYVLHLKF